MKKDTVLVFGITSNYVFALANTLIGLKNNNKKFWDDIIVYVDDISEENVKNINSILTCKIEKYDMKQIEEMVSKDLLSQYSIAAFYRYECFNLLKKYKTVIWNDVDILVQGDISGLLGYGKESGFALTENIIGLKNEANFNTFITDYNMFTTLYNSGIMVLHDSLKDYEKMKDWCVEKTAKYAKDLKWGDQAILNILIQEFNVDVDLIDIFKYCCHPMDIKHRDKASIIHAYGVDKFWNSLEYKKLFPEWYKNQDEWMAIKDHDKIDKNSPLVSCVMSTYNRYDYLKESVESILNQTYKNFELIVVLEKCENQNKIEEILKGYKDDRIVIIKNKEKLGFASSLNVGIDAAKGKYIARMDDDDISLDRRFEVEVSYLENHEEVGIVGTKAQIFGNNHDMIEVETDSELLKIMTLVKTPLVHPSVMMRKDLLDKFNLRYDPNYFCEDYELWSRAVDKFPIANIDEVLLMYRASGQNATNGSNELKIHNTHKRIMQNQFEKYLNISLNVNQLELLQGRIDVLSNLTNKEQILKYRKDTIDLIFKKNRELKYYNQDKLEKFFKTDYVAQKTSFSKKIIKKIAKPFVKPFYNSLMYRVEMLIEKHDKDIMNYIDKKIKEYKEEK